MAKAQGWISERARKEAAARNAARQAAYRARHLHDPDTVDSERLNMMVPISTKRALERLSVHYGVTKREALARILQKAEGDVLGQMTGAQQDAYYDDQLRGNDRAVRGTRKARR